MPLRLLHSLHTLHQPLEREGSSCASLLPQSPTPRESPVPLVSLYETRHKQCSRPTTPRPLTADSSAWDVAGRARTPPTPDTPRAVNRLRAECERLALDLREIRARHARESMRMQQLMKRKLAESDVNVRCLAHEFGRSEREATRERSHHERVRDAVNSELRVAKGQLAQAAEVQREALSESEGECAAQRATIAAQKREIRALSLKLQRSEAMREAQAAALQEAVASSAGWRDAEKDWAARLATAETEAVARIGMLKAELGAACEREGALHVACRTLAADVHEARESSLRLWSGQVAASDLGHVASVGGGAFCARGAAFPAAAREDATHFPRPAGGSAAEPERGDNREAAAAGAGGVWQERAEGVVLHRAAGLEVRDW